MSLPRPAYVESELACNILYWSLLEIRTLARLGKSRQAADLADAVHNVPSLLLSGGIDRQRLLADLAQYQTYYQDGTLFDYVGLLEYGPVSV